MFTVLYYWNERKLIELEIQRQAAEEETIKARTALDVATKERDEAFVQINKSIGEIEILRQSRVGMRNQITVLTIADKKSQAEIDRILLEHQTTIDEFITADPPPDYETCVEKVHASTALIGAQSRMIKNLRKLDFTKSGEITSLNDENLLLQENFNKLFEVHTKDIQTFNVYRLSIERQLKLTEQELSALKRKSAFSFLRPKITISLISVGFGFDDQKIHPIIGVGVGWAF